MDICVDCPNSAYGQLYRIAEVGVLYSELVDSKMEKTDPEE